VRASRSPSVSVLVVALAWSTSALISVAAGVTSFAVIAAFCSAVAMGIELARVFSSEKHTDDAVIARLVKQAEAGRRLAIYDRDTGLFAHWYMTLRGQEECARAARYERSLSLLVVEPRAESGRAHWTIRSEIGRWFQTELRATDIAGYVGNGRYVILAPEADSRAIDRLVARLREKVEHIDVGASAFPEDGVRFQQLWQRATARLPEHEARAA
jgi:GGDEF domain-containing protein